MAKIIYDKNPIDESQKEELKTSVTIREALFRLGIEKDPLGICVNGKYPVDLDLNYKPKDDDVIEIRREVQGGGNSSTKSTLASVVQIVGLIVASFYTGGAAASILLVSSAASAALNKWAKDLAMAGASGDVESETDTSTNSYSLSNTSNEAKPNRPVS